MLNLPKNEEATPGSPLREYQAQRRLALTLLGVLATCPCLTLLFPLRLLLAFCSASASASTISTLTIAGVSSEMRPNKPERNSLTRISDALCRSARPPLRMKPRWRAMSSSSSISVSGSSLS